MQTESQACAPSHAKKEVTIAENTGQWGQRSACPQAVSSGREAGAVARQHLPQLTEKQEETQGSLLPFPEEGLKQKWAQ